MNETEKKENAVLFLDFVITKTNYRYNPAKKEWFSADNFRETITADQLYEKFEEYNQKQKSE